MFWMYLKIFSSKSDYGTLRKLSASSRLYGGFLMPRNQFQRMVFAFITVVITVHAYVFYSIYVVNGDSLRQTVGTTSVLSAVKTIGGIYMFGRVMPVWSVVLVEFCFAYLMECVYGSPLSFKLACKNFDVKSTHPVLFESAVICATVGLTCAA